MKKSNQYPNQESYQVIFLISGKLRAVLLLLAYSSFLSQNFLDLVFLFSSNLSMRFYWFHPNNELNCPSKQNSWSLLNLTTLKAFGTTLLLLVSYGAGTPSNTLNLPKAAAPLGVLCGNIPLTVLQKILEGALQWWSPLFGLVL